MISLLANWGCGATVLSQVLDNHSKITCNGEIFTNRKNGKCSCGELYYNCKFLRKAGKEFLTPDGFHEDFYRTLPNFKVPVRLLRRCLLNCICAGKIRNTIINNVSSLRKTRDDFVTNHVNFAKSACDIEGTNIYIDGSKSIRRCEVFLESGVVNKIIYLVRDPRSQMTSKINSKIPFQERLKSITTYHKEALFLRNFYTESQFLMVRYEDFCNDPEGFLHMLTEFMEIEFDDMLNLDWQEKHFFARQE